MPTNTTFKVKEAAEIVGVSPSQVIAWGHAGAFRMYDVSGKPSATRRSYRIDKASWAAFLESRLVRPLPPRIRYGTRWPVKIEYV